MAPGGREVQPDGGMGVGVAQTLWLFVQGPLLASSPEILEDEVISGGVKERSYIRANSGCSRDKIRQVQGCVGSGRVKLGSY